MRYSVSREVIHSDIRDLIVEANLSTEWWSMLALGSLGSFPAAQLEEHARAT